MSKYFVWSRFSLYARAQLGASMRGWSFAVVALTLMCVVVAGFMLAAGGGSAFRQDGLTVVYYGGLLSSGYVFAHVLLSEWQRPETLLTQLMRPASTFEKWLWIMLSIMVLFPVVFTVVYGVVFGIAQQLAIQIKLTLDPKTELANYVMFWPWAQGNGMKGYAEAYLVSIYATGAGYLTTTLIWLRRFAAMKSVLLTVAIFLSTMTLLSMIGNPNLELLSWSSVREHREYHGFVSWLIYALNAVFWLGVPALLWVASYVAVRDKELA